MKQGDDHNRENELPYLVQLILRFFNLIKEVLIILVKIILWSIRKITRMLERVYVKFILPKIDRLYEQVYIRACRVFDCEIESTKN